MWKYLKINIYKKKLADKSNCIDCDGSSENRLSSPSSKLNLVYVGADPDTSVVKLQKCEADCDTDADCDTGLKCF